MLELGPLRLGLFESRTTHLDVLAEIASDHALLSMAFPEPPMPVSRETIAGRLRAGSIAPLSGGANDVEFAVMLGSRPRPAGIAGLYGMDRHHDVVEFGVILTDEARGQGYGADCLALLTRWAFESHGMVKVFVQIKESNRAARRAMEGLGVPCHGILPSHRFINGRHEALHVHGVLKHDWPSTPLRARLDG